MPRISKSLAHGLSEFQKYFDSMDEGVLIVLRAHLYTEAMIDRIIAAELPRGDRIIEKGGLSYSAKLTIVESCDVMDDKAVTALRALNRLRNKCAHELYKEIPRSDIEAIGRPFGADFLKIKKKAAGATGSELAEVLSFLCGNVNFTATDAEEKRRKSRGRKAP